MHKGHCPRRHQQLRMHLQFPDQIFSTKNKRAGQPTSSNNNNQQVHPWKTTMQWHLRCWRRPPAHPNTHVNTIFSMLNCDWDLERGQSVPPGKRSPPHAPACHVKGVPPSEEGETHPWPNCVLLSTWIPCLRLSVACWTISNPISVQSLVSSVTDCMGLKPRQTTTNNPLFLDDFPYYIVCLYMDTSRTRILDAYEQHYLKRVEYMHLHLN